MGISATFSYEKYLGLPAIVGRSKNHTFAGIQGQVRKKLDGWKEMFLSQAGKEILIKAVIVFRLPKTLCRNLNSLMGRFWWGSQHDVHRMSWMSWERMGKSKLSGGMGFRDLEVFNLALLAKEGWRLLQFPESPVARIMREKYFSNGSFMHAQAQLGSRPSYSWRSIFQAREVLDRGLIWRVGNGEDINIWGDKWLLSPTTYKVQSSVRFLPPSARVSELINPATGWWNFRLIRTIFNHADADSICRLVLSPLKSRDKLVWNGTKSDIFSVKSAYHMEKQRREQEAGGCSTAPNLRVFWKLVWSLPAPTVLKNFIWRVCHNLLPTKENLYRKGIVDDPKCSLCQVDSESVCLAFWSCPSALVAWQEGSRRVQKLSILASDGLMLMQQILEKLDEGDAIEAIIVARLLWLRHNMYLCV